MAEASHHVTPGVPPPVRDEAADTPLWLPLVGLCFLLLGAFAVIWQAATAEEPAAEEAATEETAEEAPAEGAAPAEAAPAEAPTAAADEHAGHGH